MNFVVTSECYNFSAAANRCAHMMARGLAAGCGIVDVIVGGTGEYLGRDHEGCTDYRFQCFAKSKEQNSSSLRYFLTMIRGIKQRRWDAIVFYSVGVQFVILLTVAHWYGLKVAYVQADHYVRLPGMSFRGRLKLAVIGAIDRYLSRHADLNALCGTQLLVDHFRAQAPQVPIYLSYPPIDIDLFADGNGVGFRNRYNLSDRKIIAYCGGISSLEGVGVLVRAMSKVAHSHPQAQLVIAGKLGDFDNSLVRQIDYPALVEELGISDRVTFTGFIDQVDVRGLLRAADILVMPKLEHRRNAVAAPIKLSEYMAAGKPVIASTVGDIGTRFHDGVELCFCIPGDSDDLAKKIVTLLDSPEVAKQIAANGQAYARNYFDYRSWGSEVSNLLKSGSR